MCSDGFKSATSSTHKHPEAFKWIRTHFQKSATEGSCLSSDAAASCQASLLQEYLRAVEKPAPYDRKPSKLMTVQEASLAYVFAIANIILRSFFNTYYTHICTYIYIYIYVDMLYTYANAHRYLFV